MVKQLRNDTLWKLAPHTQAKHKILDAYLDGWIPILSRWHGRVVFVDGFAGPGQYSEGEWGSPLIALDAAATHRADLSSCNLQFVFVEERKDRAKHLETLLTAKESRSEVPANIFWAVINETFSNAMTKVLAELGAAQLAPSFIMIDPFGPKGVPFNLITRLAGYAKTEFLISFMYEPISRFIASTEFEAHLDLLFGRPDWRDAIGKSPEEKRRMLHDLYRKQLESLGLYVRSFQMLDDGNRTEYFLFFATHHKKGISLMKDAMWRVDPRGQYSFSDATDQNQLTLFEAEPDFTQLSEQVVQRFKGTTASIEELEDFVLLETAFRPAHLRKHVLIPLEQGRVIEVSGRSRARTYPRGATIDFAGYGI